MIVGVCHLTIQIPGAQSLKDKRRVVRSLTQRVHHRYNTAVAEVGDLDLWQSAEVGFAVVSNSPAHADSMLNEIISFVEENLRDGVLTDVHTELISS